VTFSKRALQALTITQVITGLTDTTGATTVTSAFSRLKERAMIPDPEAIPESANMARLNREFTKAFGTPITRKGANIRTPKQKATVAKSIGGIW
jgi:hypothetical protein